MTEDDFDFEALMEDPFALDVMPPEPLTFRDYYYLDAALAIAETFVQYDPRSGVLLGDLPALRRKLKVLMAQAGKSNPEEMLSTLLEGLQKSNQIMQELKEEEENEF